MHIRPETAKDEDAIHQLTDDAFAPMPFGDGTEAPIIRLLRKQGDLELSLVAEVQGQIIGHVAFSPVRINGVSDNWFGLGPISVSPGKQRQGIGTTLVKAGLQILAERGAKGCALIGNPAVYKPMGFESDGELHYEPLEAKYVQRIVLNGKPPKGTLKFAPAFDLENQIES